MLIRLIPSSPHSHILYSLSFPTNLRDLPFPPAWSNQLHLLTSVLHFESPQSIHVFDRSVGLVTRIYDLTYDVPAKEVIVSFVDGRGAKIPMNAQCIQMLQSVIEDVQTCAEQEARSDTLEETSASVCSSVTSSQSIPIISSVPSKSPKLSKHKRQRSLLFSLISCVFHVICSSSILSSFWLTFQCIGTTFSVSAPGPSSITHHTLTSTSASPPADSHYYTTQCITSSYPSISNYPLLPHFPICDGSGDSPLPCTSYINRCMEKTCCARTFSTQPLCRAH